MFVIDAIVAPAAIPVPVTDIPTASEDVLAVVTVASVLVVSQMSVFVPFIDCPTTKADVLAVVTSVSEIVVVQVNATDDIVKWVVSGFDAMVASAGIPVPTTPIPTASVVESAVTEFVLSTVVLETVVELE